MERVCHCSEAGRRLLHFLSSLVAEESPSRALAGAGYSAYAAAGVKFSVAKAANTKDQGGQMAVFVRNISLAPTRHPNLNC